MVVDLRDEKVGRKQMLRTAEIDSCIQSTHGFRKALKYIQINENHNSDWDSYLDTGKYKVTIFSHQSHTLRHITKSTLCKAESRCNGIGATNLVLYRWWHTIKNLGNYY